MRQDLTDISAGAPRPQRKATPLAWLLLSPLLLWVAAFVVAPTLIMLAYSFCKRGTLGGVVWEFTLANYAAVLDPTYLRILVRSVVFAGITAGVLLVFVPALGLYAVNDILGGGKVDMIGNIIENQFKGTARNWPFGAALGMTLVVAFSAALWYTGRRQHREA